MQAPQAYSLVVSGSIYPASRVITDITGILNYIYYIYICPLGELYSAIYF